MDWGSSEKREPLSQTDRDLGREAKTDKYRHTLDLFPVQFQTTAIKRISQ